MQKGRHVQPGPGIERFMRHQQRQRVVRLQLLVLRPVGYQWHLAQGSDRLDLHPGPAETRFAVVVAHATAECPFLHARFQHGISDLDHPRETLGDLDPAGGIGRWQRRPPIGWYGDLRETHAVFTIRTAGSRERGGRR